MYPQVSPRRSASRLAGAYRQTHSRSERDILRRAVGIDLLGKTGRMDSLRLARRSRSMRADERDAVLALRAPDGSRGNAVIEAKRVGKRATSRMSPGSSDAFGSWLQRTASRPAHCWLRRTLIRPHVFAWLRTASYMPTPPEPFFSGLIASVLSPRDVGTDRDPWRGPGRPRASSRAARWRRTLPVLSSTSPRR